MFDLFVSFGYVCLPRETLNIGKAINNLAIKLNMYNVSEIVRFLTNRIKLVDSKVIFVNYYIKQIT